MNEEHLYPARAGMLRRGTPLEAGHVVVSAGARLCVVANRDGMEWQAITEHQRLDLRDVTARAHAAMPYTYVECDGSIVIDGSIDTAGAAHHADDLCRMRASDEFVTVAEARAALDWAHAASGG